MTSPDDHPLQRPYVLRELCTGRGIFEARCPIDGEAAIGMMRA